MLMMENNQNIDEFENIDLGESSDSVRAETDPDWNAFVLFVTDGIRPEGFPDNYALDEDELELLSSLLDKDPYDPRVQEIYSQFAGILTNANSFNNSNELFDISDLDNYLNYPEAGEDLQEFLEPQQEGQNILAQMNEVEDDSTDADIFLGEEDNADSEIFDLPSETQNTNIFSQMDEINPNDDYDSSVFEESHGNDLDTDELFSAAQEVPEFINGTEPESQNNQTDSTQYTHPALNTSTTLGEHRPTETFDRSILMSTVNGLGGFGRNIASISENVSGMGATWAANKYKDYQERTRQVNEVAKETVNNFMSFNKEQSAQFVKESRENRLESYLDRISDVMQQVKSSRDQLDYKVADSEMSVLDLKAESEKTDNPVMKDFFEKHLKEALLDQGMDSIVEHSNAIADGNKLIENYLAKAQELAVKLDVDMEGITESLADYEEVLTDAKSTLDELVDTAKGLDVLNEVDEAALKATQEKLSESVKAFIEMLKNMFSRSDLSISEPSM
jgi:hypothetical protein